MKNAKKNMTIKSKTEKCKMRNFTFLLLNFSEYSEKTEKQF